MNMPFESYYIGSSDFDFYMSLPEDEKLLFLHDLICSDYYELGSIDDFNFPNKDNISGDIDNSTYQTLVSSVLDQAIDYKSQVNVIFINELVVFNSYSKKLMSYAVLDMSFDGVILSKVDVPKNVEFVFKKQDYYEVYKVLDITNPILPKTDV